MIVLVVGSHDGQARMGGTPQLPQHLGCRHRIIDDRTGDDDCQQPPQEVSAHMAFAAGDCFAAGIATLPPCAVVFTT